MRAVSTFRGHPGTTRVAAGADANACVAPERCAGRRLRRWSRLCNRFAGGGARGSGNGVPQRHGLRGRLLRERAGLLPVRARRLLPEQADLLSRGDQLQRHRHVPNAVCADQRCWAVQPWSLGLQAGRAPAAVHGPAERAHHWRFRLDWLHPPGGCTHGERRTSAALAVGRQGWWCRRDGL